MGTDVWDDMYTWGRNHAFGVSAVKGLAKSLVMSNPAGQLYGQYKQLQGVAESYGFGGKELAREVQQNANNEQLKAAIPVYNAIRSFDKASRAYYVEGNEDEAGELFTEGLINTATSAMVAVGGVRGIQARAVRLETARLQFIDETKALNAEIQSEIKALNNFNTLADQGYVRVGPARVIYNGMEVRGVRSMSHVSTPTLQAMERIGFSGTGIEGDPMILHHLKQNPLGPVVEIPAPRHSIWNSIQHPFGNTSGAGLTEAQRSGFNLWRENYWSIRALEELMLRGAR